MAQIILVPGTWSAYRGHDPDEWWYPGTNPGAALLPPSPFVDDVLRPLGYSPVIYKWSTDLDGGARWPWQWFRSQTHTDWLSWGDEFASKLSMLPFDQRIVLCHSHGGNVMAVAASQIAVRLLITVSTPVRLGDMWDFYRRAALKCQRWIHIHSDNDKTQLFGSFFDGHFGFVRANPYAHENVFVPRKGHSKILTDRGSFDFWQQSGIAGHLLDAKA